MLCKKSNNLWLVNLLETHTKVLDGNAMAGRDSTRPAVVGLLSRGMPVLFETRSRVVSEISLQFASHSLEIDCFEWEVYLKKTTNYTAPHQVDMNLSIFFGM